MLIVYAVSLLAMYEPEKGPPQIEHISTWMILDERQDPDPKAEELVYEWFPEEDGFYHQSFHVKEVPLKVMRRAVEVNLYEEEPPTKRASAGQSRGQVRQPARQPSGGRDRRQEERRPAKLARYR